MGGRGRNAAHSHERTGRGLRRKDMNAPTIPIPFHKLLKVVVIVDAEIPEIRQLLDRIAGENLKIEVSNRFDRDVSEDASVGA